MENTNSIKDMIRQIPELPGIYKMLDSNRNIIYIGKSKCLRKRVTSYFVSSPKWEKVKQMVPLIRDIEYIVTDTHLEARLLECELIKYHQPRFNAQMKNDRRYIYIKVDTYNPNHAMSVVPERETDCFGPFRSQYKMKEFIDKLKNIFPIQMTDSGYTIEYNIFPLKMNKETFEQNRTILLELFNKEKSLSLFLVMLQQKLEDAASLYRYEIASYYRDLILGFTNIKYGLDGYQKLTSRTILLKIPVRGGYKLFYVSSGSIRDSKIVPELSDSIVNDFIEESSLLTSSSVTDTRGEKSHIDFRDVLYSEISDLPEESVVML